VEQGYHIGEAFVQRCDDIPGVRIDMLETFDVEANAEILSGPACPPALNVVQC
jgi:hypothetical protein